MVNNNRENNETQTEDVDTQTDHSTNPDGTPTDETTPVDRDTWTELPANPDAHTDFGYSVAEWESFDTADGSDQTMFLPADDSLIEEDAFVVAEAEALCELGEWC